MDYICEVCLATSGALLPLHVDNLPELEVGGVGREQTSSLRVCGCQPDLRVNVQQVALAAARRHDDRRAIGFVVFEVVSGHGTNEVVLRASLGLVSKNLEFRVEDSRT